MVFTLKDLATGATLALDRPDIRPFDLAEGNWSCDCNRGLAFGVGDLADHHCAGTFRFVVVEHDAEGWTVAEFNEGYPAHE